jgi:predicted permease
MLMKIPLKYGLLITFGAIAWVVLAHLLVPDPRSPVHSLGAGIFFNILHIAGIYLAITTLRKETGGELGFKEGVKTGIATAFVYALSFCLFFTVAIFVVGSRLMASEPGAENQPLWQVALGAFAALFLGSLIFGLIYSTLISFFLAKRRGVNRV